LFTSGLTVSLFPRPAGYPVEAFFHAVRGGLRRTAPNSRRGNHQSGAFLFFQKIASGWWFRYTAKSAATQPPALAMTSEMI
jgi:hypothetical protein